MNDDDESDDDVPNGDGAERLPSAVGAAANAAFMVATGLACSPWSRSSPARVEGAEDRLARTAMSSSSDEGLFSYSSLVHVVARRGAAEMGCR